MSFNEVVYTVAFFAIEVINHRVAEIINVSAGLPGIGVHKDGGINPYNIFVGINHAFPPMFADVLFEFNAPLAVIVHGAETVVNFARRENKPVFFAMGNNSL